MMLGLTERVGAAPTSLKIVPGPTVQSEAERALTADPARGIEHAVILLEERIVDEWRGTDGTEFVHVRAKILSNEGRDLANVAIRWQAGTDTLAEWWGRTILPDGRVFELKKEDLVVQPLAKYYGRQWKEYRAALPAVEPGAIIDYGYDLRARGFWRKNHIPLQRPWPILEMRLRWRPVQHMNAAYHVRAPGLDVKLDRDEGAIRLLAHDLPALADEPFMPPDPQVRAGVTLYYPGASLESYWEDRGKSVHRQVNAYFSQRARLDAAMSGLALDAGAPLEAKLRQAYAWVSDHVRDVELERAEEQDALADEASRTRHQARKLFTTVDDVVARGSGSDFEVAVAFLGMARSLGADAWVVLGADRRETLYDPEMKDLRPFRHAMVAVRPAGTGGPFTLVDPGSGLPYGEVPWWLTGVPALRAAAEGFAPIQIPVPAAAQNVEEAKAEVTIDLEQEQTRLVWSRFGKGQQGLEERRDLRDLDAAERKKSLSQLCRYSADDEVEEAQAPGLEHLGEPYRLSCRVTHALDMDAAEADELRFGFRGPWIEPPPDFQGRTARRHPVVLDFPRVAVGAITLKAPVGFVPGDPPASVAFDSPFGRYKLAVKVVGSAFQIERGFALLPVSVPAAEYPQLTEFLGRVRRADATELVFRRDGGS
ncbi:MAG TPA: DUF3857 domain-containing protein [Candidatus Polarisedimenticolaceae bacterium]|nr:DUF3857 domain-containing protein [Candidatus Polarisedimenticolaceae bacterium]